MIKDDRSETRSVSGTSKPGVTRRTFVRGAAALPATAQPSWIFAAASENRDDRADLVFLRAQDGESVVVRLVILARSATDTSPAEHAASPVDWLIKAKAFGPRAWFDLDPRDFTSGSDQRRLVVRDASFGRLDRDADGKPLHVTFDFRRRCAPGPKPKADVVRTWTIGLATNVWSGSGGAASIATEGENRKGLRRFIAAAPSQRLSETLSKDRLERALRAMFDEQLSAQERMSVGLDAEMVWHLAPVTPGTKPIAAFDGTVRGPADGETLTIAWQDPQNPDGGGRRQLLASCNATWSGALTFGAPNSEFQATLAPIGEKTASHALVVGELDRQTSTVADGGRSPGSVLAVLSWPQAKLNCGPGPSEVAPAGRALGRAARSAPPPSCEALPLSDLKISRIRLTGVNRWRTAVVADAGGPRAGIQAAGSPATSMRTTIGRLRIAPLSDDTMSAKASADTQKETSGEAEKRQFAAAAAAAIGDRSGVADRTFFLLADRPAPARPRKTDRAASIYRLYADVALLGLDAALPGTSDSAVVFAGSHFRLVYADGRPIPELPTPETAWTTPDGFLWLGKTPANREVAAIDLGGATIHARRDQDLVDLRFRFADLVLAFGAGPVGKIMPPVLRPARKECRVVVGNRHASDSRPILGVDFVPQHVMEEAFFRPEPEPLPDTAWPESFEYGDIGSFLAALSCEPSEAEREKMRRKLGRAKEAAGRPLPGEAVQEARDFAALRKAILSKLDLPKDQREYIGPYAMSASAIRHARAWQAERLTEWLTGDKAEKDEGKRGLIGRLLTNAWKVGKDPEGGWTEGALFAAEAEAERAYPLYKLFRDAFRAWIIETQNGLDPARAEFVNPLREGVKDTFATQRGTLEAFRIRFAEIISGKDPIDRLAMARLSRGSRLSFRINCEPAPGDSAEADGLPSFPADSSAAPGPGVQRFGSLAFTFAALTDWSRHEPHVTMRARKLYQPLASGAMPPLAGRVASIDDQAILESQGFKRGAKSAEAHLSQVKASLLRDPEGLETGIELPARVILSTAQDAIWQAPRKVERSHPARRADGAPPAPEIFETNPRGKQQGVDFSSYAPLWSARLLIGEAAPSLRAIHSPDMRPEAIGFVAPGGAGVPRIAGPPPRGPWAPWVLRREQVDGVHVDPKEAAKSFGDAGDAAAPDALCDAEISRAASQRPSMLRRICEIFRLRAVYKDVADLHTFRTSLDAYDRHELVLLSSAYGLPVTGKRKQLTQDATRGGELFEASDQFEPGADFVLTDADPDLAYYRPKPLDVTELSLSALGGSLSHDTNFLPPAPALTYDARPMFDGLSIERWQHQVVLGRDTLATVVYAGYLLPLGHKASLVKVTERIVLDVKGEGVKAVLRQRMFVRVSLPVKAYPAVGQPNGGRQWCAETVTMLTRQTPDIIDPTLEIEGVAGKRSLSGRIDLGGAPGLAFWPQTAMAEEARVQFEFQIDGCRTRLPLIFVDRIAAKYPAALAKLIGYYADRDIRWRTASLGGQTLRFAEPNKRGDTSFATETLILSVEGREKEDGSWAGTNDVVANTGVLEGADQPPFYPVMSKAEIRIEQAERMTGAAMPAAPVRFDGRYVNSGFDHPADTIPAKPDPAAKAPAPGNAAELFLYVDSADPPALLMGPNGHQSGGIGRPEMRIVGLSRSKGIMGADKNAPAYQAKPGASLTPYPNDPESLQSIASYFSLPPRPAPPAAAQGGPQKQPDPYATVFESFFSADAKLLGVVTFRELMKLLSIAGGVDAIPVLQEVVDYGSQALGAAEQAAGDVMDLLRSQVLAPLLTLVRKARAEWTRLDRLARDGQENILEKIHDVFKSLQAKSFSDLYPEIDRGLAKLETAIVAAMAETDPLKLTSSLGAVYEAGRQFMGELARLAANPIERLEQAARAQLSLATHDLTGKIDEYRALANGLGAALKQYVEGEAKALGDKLAAYLIDRLGEDDLDTLLQAMDDRRELADLVEKVIEGLKVEVDLSSVVRDLAEGTPPGQAILQAVRTIVDAADKAAADTTADELDDSGEDDEAVATAKAVLKAAIDRHRAMLLDAKGVAERWLKGPESAPPEWRAWVERVERIERLATLLQELAKGGGQRSAFDILTQIGRDYLGIHADSAKDSLKDKLQKEKDKLDAWVDEVRKGLRALASDVAGAAGPTLPAGVFEACLAETPVDATGASEAKRISDAFDQTPQHWLKPFADSMAATFQAEPILVTIAGPDSPPESERAAKAVKGQLSAYRRLFCQVTVIVGRAERAQAELANTSDVVATWQRLRRVGVEIATDLRRLEASVRSILAAFSNDAKNFALTIALAEASRVISGVDAVELKEWQAATAQGLLTSLQALLRVAGVAAAAASDAGGTALSGLARIVRDVLPASVGPDREEFAAALENLKAAAAKPVMDLRAMTIVASPQPPQTVDDLLDAKIGQVRLGEALFGPNVLIQTKPIQEAFDRVSLACDRLVARLVGLPRLVTTDALKGPVIELLTAVEKADQWMKLQRQALIKGSANLGQAGSVLRNAVLVPPTATGCDPLREDCDKLAEELHSLDELLSTPPDPLGSGLTKLQAYAASIVGGRCAIEAILRNFQRIWDDIVRGDILAFVDIASLRAEVEDIISQLIPVKRTLRYSLGYDFDAGRVGEATLGVFQPKAPGRFELDMTATIDLIRPKAEMKAAGHMGPFDIKLVGDIFDAVTLMFDGIDFSYEAGGSPRFDVHYRDFKIGKNLKFIEQLQAYLTPPKGGNGFFIEPSRSRPGISAGYGLNLGTIQLGGTAFSNVLLAVSADLPFDGTPALFNFSLGRALSPFLVSVPPFGGGGFVGILADAEGFRGVEASLEFGGVADFSAGPLVAVARITSGFYIRSLKVKVGQDEKTLTDIYGTFFAGGAASIWIFDFYASLYVRLGMTADGDMEGLAVFTFSFSMGIVDYSFSVSVRRKQKALGGGGVSSGRSVALASRADRAAEAKSRKPKHVPNVAAQTEPLSTRTIGAFLDYFDPSLIAAEQVR